jgi:hypothetical protein
MGFRLAATLRVCTSPTNIGNRTHCNELIAIILDRTKYAFRSSQRSSCRDLRSPGTRKNRRLVREHATCMTGKNFFRNATLHV